MAAAPAARRPHLRRPGGCGGGGGSSFSSAAARGAVPPPFAPAPRSARAPASAPCTRARGRPLGTSAWRGGASRPRLRPPDAVAGATERRSPPPPGPPPLRALTKRAAYMKPGQPCPRTDPGFGPPPVPSVIQDLSLFLQPPHRSPRPTLVPPNTCTPTPPGHSRSCPANNLLKCLPTHANPVST